jgi:hypothetical protein
MSFFSPLMISIWSPYELHDTLFFNILYEFLQTFDDVLHGFPMGYVIFSPSHLCELLHFELQFVCLQCTSHSSIVNITCKLFANCFHFKLLDLPLLSTIVATKFSNSLLWMGVLFELPSSNANFAT